MADRDGVEALIERIVTGAHIPSRSTRDDLRRELQTHFDEAASSPDAIREAIRRFGSEALVAESLQRVYRSDYVLLYLAKIAASIVASAIAALLIEVFVNLRIGLADEVWRLAPGFSHAAVLSVAVVLAMVAGWEASRRPFSRSRALTAIGMYVAVCAAVQPLTAGNLSPFVTAAILATLGYLSSRFSARLATVVSTFAAFAGAEYGLHFALNVNFGIDRALLAAAVLVGVWAATLAILGRADHLFGRHFNPV